MCGIAGILKPGSAAESRALVREMVAALAHRGPDEANVYVDSQVALGHARLSILDIDGGRQPMSIEDGAYRITFNGEIFNYLELQEELRKKGHQFVTRSDTEVILRLYAAEGKDCVHRLNGQWAFAIWDARRQELFLSRDRMGIIPLFYTFAGRQFLFASEIKSLFECSDVKRHIDLEGLDQLFTFWATLAPRTVFKGIFQLPPGHCLTVDGSRVQTRRFWQPTYAPASEFNLNLQDSDAGRLLELLWDATRIRLRSDVPVGAYLSGGIDSTLITALALRVAGGVLSSFSVSFDDPNFDESWYQQAAARYLNTRHHELRCSDQQLGEIFPEVIWHAEQPVLRTAPAPLYLLSRLARSEGCRVVLSGEGSDEVFGGYDIFKEAKIRRFWAAHQESGPLLLKRLYPYLPNVHNQPPAYLKSFFHTSANEFGSPFFSHLPRWVLTSKLKLLFSEQVKSDLAGYSACAELLDTLPPDYSGWPGLCQAQYLETSLLLPGYILSSQGDRMAMAHSIETRHPFLDHRLVDFGAKLHPSFKLFGLKEKYLLKRAAKDVVPACILERPKQPYRAPEAISLLAAPEFPDELLSGPRVQRDGLFNPAAVSALVAKFRSGRAIGIKDNMALVGILSTQLVLDQFIYKNRSSYAAVTAI